MDMVIHLPNVNKAENTEAVGYFLLRVPGQDVKWDYYIIIDSFFQSDSLKIIKIIEYYILTILCDAQYNATKRWDDD
jgi:hypothetical protein